AGADSSVDGTGLDGGAGLAKAGADTLRGEERRRDAGAGQDNRKLLAAEPADQVAAAQCLGRDAAEGAQDLIAPAVAIRVVDRLEAVEVEHDHGQSGTVLAACRDDALGAAVKRAPRPDPRGAGAA